MNSNQSIVVGYDGSEAARGALEWALDRAGPEGKVVVVYAFEPPRDWVGDPHYDRILHEHRARGQALLDELPEDTRIEHDLLPGRPAEAIVTVAATHDAEEIVVGSRGFGALRAALGSVSHELLQRTDRPVVVVPTSDQA